MNGAEKKEFDSIFGHDIGANQRLWAKAGWKAACEWRDSQVGEPVACIGTNGELMWLNKPNAIYSKPLPLYLTPPTAQINRERIDEHKSNLEKLQKDLQEQCRTLIKQYYAVKEYELGGALTNGDFLRIERALTALDEANHAQEK